MNERRRALIALGSVAFAGPLVAYAQQPAKLRRIGVLTVALPERDTNFERFKQRLRELGYVDGKTVVFDYVSVVEQYERLPATAAELVQRKPDVIFTSSTPATLAVKNATRTIPTVFVGVADPVGQGIVASLARPGGNLTGMSIQTGQTSAKTLELLKEIVPSATRIAVLSNPANESMAGMLLEIGKAARHLRVETVTVHASTAKEIAKAFAEATRGGAEGLVIPSDATLNRSGPEIAALAVKSKLPTIGGSSLYPEQGGLISYGANRPAYVRRGAELVDRILKGAMPADLPVEQPTKFDLIVNLKTAKALGITIPKTVLVWADKVIE